MLLSVLLALFVFSVFAQSEKGYIYLKNGTILKGKYLYSQDMNKLKVESAGNLWVFEVAEVDSVVTKKARQKNDFIIEKSASPVFLRTETGVLIGNSDNSQPAPFSFTSSINYLVWPNISAGIGIGLEFLKESYLPAFINAEYKIRNSQSTPYVFVKAGYQIPLEDSREVYYYDYPVWSDFWPGPDYQQSEMKAKGGVLINPGIGYQRMFSSGFGMSFAFGYQFHRLHYSGENEYGLDIDYNRLTLKLGIIFN